MKHIYEPAFKYTPAVGTDVRKTFERIRREQEQARAETKQIVSQIKPRVRGKA